jgi:hypothetical protein
MYDLCDRTPGIFSCVERINFGTTEPVAQSVIQRNFAKGERIHGTGKVCLGFLIIKKDNSVLT